MFLEALFILNAILSTESQYIHNYAFPYKPALARNHEMLVANIKVAPDETHVITTPNYPDTYMAPLQLGWIATCPDGYICKLNCTDIDLPCNLDFMEYYSPKVRDADVQEICGDQPFSFVAPNNKLIIGLDATARFDHSEDSGKLRCEITALKLRPCKCGCIGRTLHKDSEIQLQSSSVIPELSMVAGVFDRNLGRVLCGGAIISQHYVVATATCVKKNDASTLSVVIGPFGNRLGFLYGAHSIEVTRKHMVHMSNSSRPEISILELRDNINFNDDVYPACIPVSEKYVVGKSAVMIGWHFINNFTKQLTVYLDLLIINHSTCWGSFPYSFYVKNQQQALCTFSKHPASVNAAGPIFLTSESGQVHFIGLSTGEFYASHGPSYHTRILPVNNWRIDGAPIQSKLKYYKKKK